MKFDITNKDGASFKDPSGYVFYNNDKVYRKINPFYLKTYEALKEQGFYGSVIDSKWLIPFEEEIIDGEIFLVSEKISFISYPYEWTPSQMREMAIFYLEFLDYCLKSKVMIKDASAFNLQFHKGQIIFIDLLSFEVIDNNYAWKSYQQFCTNFLTTLLISKFCKTNGNRQLLLHIDGVPLVEAINVLPFKANFNGLVLFHLKAQVKFQSTKKSDKEIIIGLQKTRQIISHLKSGIEDLRFNDFKSNWSEYSQELPYDKTQNKAKYDVVKGVFQKNNFVKILDIGANHHLFAKKIYPENSSVVMVDNDLATIDQMYSKGNTATILHIDITSPTPAIGLKLEERKSFLQRTKPEVVIALALVHHLFHSRSIPLSEIAKIFGSFESHLLVEFVGPADEKFQLIANKGNYHPYSQELFEAEFNTYFQLVHKSEVKAGKRWVYHYEPKL